MTTGHRLRKPSEEKLKSSFWINSPPLRSWLLSTRLMDIAHCSGVGSPKHETIYQSYTEVLALSGFSVA